MSTDTIATSAVASKSHVWQEEILPNDASRASWWQRWDLLNRSGCRGHPLLDSLFAAAAERFFANTPLMHLACRDNAGDVAMALVARRSLWEWSLFQPSQAPLPFLVYRRTAEDPEPLLRSLLTRTAVAPLRLDIARLDPRLLRLGDSTAGPHLGIVSAGTTIAVTSSSFAAYWASRAPSLRKNLRKIGRRLEATQLTPRFERVSDPTMIGSAVDDYGRLESDGWKGRRGTALNPGNEQGAFYRTLMECYARRGDGYAYRLWLGDKLAAMRLAILGEGMAVILKTTYDESLAAFAPGRLLLRLVLKDLIEHPRVDRIEFYTNANRDTLAWGTESRRVYAASVYRWAAIKSLADGLHALKYRTERRSWRP